MDRLSRRIDQLGKAETLIYDGNGNLVSTTDRKNQTAIFTYDPLNRRTQASYADGAVARFTYDAGSRLTQADDTADPHRPPAMTYDTLDRLLTETTSLGTVSYAYDVLGRRTQLLVSGQSPVSYAYDAKLPAHGADPEWPGGLAHLRRREPPGRRSCCRIRPRPSTSTIPPPASRRYLYRNAGGFLGICSIATTRPATAPAWGRLRPDARTRVCDQRHVRSS